MGTHLRLTQKEISNEYQHDRVEMVFKNLCVLVLWTKVASALEGLSHKEVGSINKKEILCHYGNINIVLYCKNLEVPVPSYGSAYCYRYCNNTSILTKIEQRQYICNQMFLDSSSWYNEILYCLYGNIDIILYYKNLKGATP